MNTAGARPAQPGTDLPFLVTLEPRGYRFVPGKFLTAADLPGAAAHAEHPAFKAIVLNASTGEPAVPNGSLGFRYGEQDAGRWKLDLGGTDPLLAAGPVWGAWPGLPGGWPSGYDDPAWPYTPAWQAPITGVGAATVARMAREFAANAEETGCRSMIIVGAHRPGGRATAARHSGRTDHAARPGSRLEGGRRARHPGGGGQPASRTPRNSAAKAVTPVSAPNMASPAVLLARACRAAETPDRATAMSLTTRVTS